MKAAVISVTRKGAFLGMKVARILREKGWHTDVLTMGGPPGEIEGAIPLNGTLGSNMGDLFSRYRCLVMIMAMGIVIRTIAPHVRDKKTDPAVVVMDEGGQYAISALSGHLGGANDIARLIAGSLGCAAVITTATDAGGVPAVDLLARDFKMVPDPVDYVKKVNAALARGERVALYSRYQIPVKDSDLIEVRPWSAIGEKVGGWRIIITGQDPFNTGDRDILLRPRNIVVGVGCKRGAGREVIINQIKRGLGAAGRSLACVRALATIEARTTEEGIKGAARELGVPVLGFGSGELNGAVEKFGLEKSERVLERMGVGGVCEPAAMLACRKGRLLAGKIKGAGVTVAVAEEESGWWE